MTDKPENWQEIKDAIRYRYKSRCFRCYEKKVLYVHRLDDCDEWHYAMHNIIPLCKSCLSYVKNNDLKTKREIDTYGYDPSPIIGTPSRIRRVIMKENGGSYTKKQFEDLCEKHGNRCINPDCKNPYAELTADHIIPITWEGSTNYIENIQPLCGPCNSSKGNYHATDYRSQ